MAKKIFLITKQDMVMVQILASIFILIVTSSQVYGSSLLPEEIYQYKLEEQAIKVKASKLCGDIYALEKPIAPLIQLSTPTFFSYPGHQFVKLKRKFPFLTPHTTDEFSYHTPKAKIFITHPKASTWNKKQIKAFLRQQLAANLQERALARFSDEITMFSAIEQKAFTKHFKRIQNKLFYKNRNHPSRQIRLLLTLYPELRRELIHSEQDPFRPLLCRYELKKHRQKILRRWSNVLVLNALALGVTSIVIGSQGISIPALVIVAATSATVVGVRDIAFGIINWRHKENAAIIAARYKLMLKQVQKTHKLLKQKAMASSLNPAEQQLLNHLQEIDESFSHKRRKRLTKIVNGKHFNRLTIAFAVLNAGFNGINFTGDASLLANLPTTILTWLKIL